MVMCLERGADLHMTQLMPMALTVSCFRKIQSVFTFLVLAHPGSPGKGAVKQVCIYVYANTLKFALCMRSSNHLCTLHFHQLIAASSSLALHLATCRLQCLCFQRVNLFIVGCVGRRKHQSSRLVVAIGTSSCTGSMIQVQILYSINTTQSTRRISLDKNNNTHTHTRLTALFPGLPG